MLREGFTFDALEPSGVYFGTQSGSVFASTDAGESWTEAARQLPPVLSVETAAWSVVRLPSLLAAQAGGQREFEVEAATRRRRAARSCPVADLLLDERGELRRLVNVYVDGEDVARAATDLDTPLSRMQERSASSPQSAGG